MYFIKRFTGILMAAAGIFALLTMTGCWDDAEINGRAFVLGFGADSGGEAYRFTFQLAIPVSGESDSSGSIQYTSRTVEGRTPAAAVRTLEKDLGRQINFEQLSLIVIGERLSRKDFTGLTDYFFRRASVRRQSCIAVCSGSAEAFFGSSATDKAISTEAASALQSYDAGSGGIAMNLFLLYRILVNRDEFFLPKISAAAEDAGGKALLTLSGASAYGREGQFRGDLSEEELELLRLTRGSGTGGSLTVQDGSGNRYCCQVRQSDCSVKCTFANGCRRSPTEAVIPLARRFWDCRTLSGSVSPTGTHFTRRIGNAFIRHRKSLSQSIALRREAESQNEAGITYGCHRAAVGSLAWAGKALQRNAGRTVFHRACHR